MDGADADRFDVAIIGGGIACAAAAWALAPYLRVVLLEGESGLGYPSTGRSAAILTESCEARPIRDLTGRSRTILTTEFATVPGLLTDRGVLWVASTGQDAAVERASAAARESPTTVDLLDPDTAQALCPVDVVGDDGLGGFQDIGHAAGGVGDRGSAVGASDEHDRSAAREPAAAPGAMVVDVADDPFSGRAGR